MRGKNLYGSQVYVKYLGRGSWVAMTCHAEKDANADINAGSHFRIFLYNIDTKKWKVIDEPDNIRFDGYNWMDDSTILVQTTVTDGTGNQATYFVDINKLGSMH